MASDTEPTTRELDKWQAFYERYASSQGPDSATTRILRLIAQNKRLRGQLIKSWGPPDHEVAQRRG